MCAELYACLQLWVLDQCFIYAYWLTVFKGKRSILGVLIVLTVLIYMSQKTMCWNDYKLFQHEGNFYSCYLWTTATEASWVFCFYFFSHAYGCFYTSLLLRMKLILMHCVRVCIRFRVDYYNKLEGHPQQNVFQLCVEHNDSPYWFFL